MANQNQPNVNEDEARSETKMMWIAVGVIVLIIVGGMGINMMIHHDTNASTVETSSPQQ
jgi:flagellar basal body-associated protein FliL